MPLLRGRGGAKLIVFSYTVRFKKLITIVQFLFLFKTGMSMWGINVGYKNIFSLVTYILRTNF